MSTKSRPASRTKITPSESSSHRRKMVVFVSLVGVLSMTAGLLKAIAPAPLSPGMTATLLAVDAPVSPDPVSDTETPLREGHWQYVFIHHSKTPAGSADSLTQAVGAGSDHFVIGSGDGRDGEADLHVGPRWKDQQPAAPAAGLKGIQPNCISICLVGDFNRTRPTAAQMRRLNQLVSSLQARFNLETDHVWTLDANATAAGIGKFFPQGEFRRSLGE